MGCGELWCLVLADSIVMLVVFFCGCDLILGFICVVVALGVTAFVRLARCEL